MKIYFWRRRRKAKKEKEENIWSAKEKEWEENTWRKKIFCVEEKKFNLDF